MLPKKLQYILSTVICILATCACSNNYAEANQTTTVINEALRDTNTIVLDSSAILIFDDQLGRLWFASHEKGVYCYDGESLSLFTEKDGIESYRILNVQADKAGTLYFDTPEAVYKFDGDSFSALPIAKEPQREWKSAPGNLWFRMGWDNNGPYRYDGKKLVHLPFPKNNMEDVFYEKNPNASFNPYAIYSMRKDSKGRIWFGTSNLGVYVFDGKEISWMYENHLLETPEGGNFGVRSIGEDSTGTIWISNARYRYTIRENNTTEDGLKPINYERHEGISDIINSDLYFYAMELDRTGNLLMFAKEDGLWLNNGEMLTPFFIQKDERRIAPTSIYKDSQGIIWLGTQADGIYKYDGIGFEQFKMD